MVLVRIAGEYPAYYKGVDQIIFTSSNSTGHEALLEDITEDDFEREDHYKRILIVNIAYVAQLLIEEELEDDDVGNRIRDYTDDK